MRGENIKIERLLEKYSPFFTNMACGSKNIKVFKVDCPPNAWVFLRLMVLNAAIVGGIIYGKVAGNSLAEISENLKKLGFDVPRSSVANTIEKLPVMQANAPPHAAPDAPPDAPPDAAPNVPVYKQQSTI